MSACEHCGCSLYTAQLAERYADKLEGLQREYEHQAARHGAEIARWRLQEFDRADDHKGLQRKVSAQRRTINRLESKLRTLGAPPYAIEATG